MKKSLNLVYFVILLTSNLFSQNKEKKYYNTSFDSIGEKEFYNLLKRDNYNYNSFELADQHAYVLYQRKAKGKLSTDELAELNKYLLNMGSIDNKINVIIYYPGKDYCNKKEGNSTWNIFDSDYSKEVKKINTVNQFWIYKSDEDLKYYYPKKVQWRKDEGQFIENLFFKMHYPCFSSAIIDEDGNYILNLGEFGKHEIWKYLKELSSK